MVARGLAIPTIKLIHIACAYLTGAGFLLRGIWALREHRLVQHRLSKVLPHVIDTLLLASALAMVFAWSIEVSVNTWLLAKLAALFVYIGFGLLMLRFAKTQRDRIIGLTGGLLSYAYIVSVAHSKAVLPGLF